MQTSNLKKYVVFRSRWTKKAHMIIAAVFGRKNNLTENMELPKVVVTSFNMLTRLRESMLSRKWGMVIVDEAHNIRCTSRKVECDEVSLVFIVTVTLRSSST